MPEYRVTVNGRTYTVNIGRVTDDMVNVTLDGKTYDVRVEIPAGKPSKTPVITRSKTVVDAAESPSRTAPPGAMAAGGTVTSPLPGVVLKVLVKEGETVSEGQPVAVLEAMKMENEIEAPVSGKVEEVLVKEGDNVLENAALIRIGSGE